MEKIKCNHLWERDYVNQDVVFDIKDKTYAIEGCCGGGCYVIHSIKFCPFCGEKLKV